MKIQNDFIKGNNKIKIISNGGQPHPIRADWQTVLSKCDMLVIIPDMHMYIYNSHLDNFKYGADAMLKFLNHLGTLKDERHCVFISSVIFMNKDFPVYTDRMQLLLKSGCRIRVMIR